ncbi:CAP domain-containing protein [Mycobacterium sp.]|uniref:CAP domain-containing protein n=1 Tax=Mycobacterium sp. TaxID=1785 RepID=UPI002C60B10F|nr:CAP domain-containing protein [Mycobacterium sp.]HTY34506.1 CAP domain-containing protein [Mycobacterium sp.]
MTSKVKIVAGFSICTVLVTALGAVAGFAARADNSGTAIYGGINRLRQTCGVIGDDPRLKVAAQRHADDMLKTGVNGHVGSDGSSPQARITDAGYTRTSNTGEIVYWGTGSAATPGAALDAWMGSPPHRGIILNCAFTAAGFATAWDGIKMTAVGDFAGP